MKNWEFDMEFNMFWWSLGLRVDNRPYCRPEILVGLGPVLLVFTGKWA